MIIILHVLLVTLSSQGNTEQPVAHTGVIDETLKNGVFEISFLYENTVSNPYDPDIMEVNGCIILPDGQTVCIPAFWYEGYTRSLEGKDEVLVPDGENVWKIRFTPRDAGIYHYYIEIRDKESDVSIRIPATGSNSFSVTAGNSKGFLQPADKNPAYLEYDTGEFFFGIGHNLCGWEWPGRYDSEAWNGTDNSRGTYEYDEWFEKMEESGANLTQFDFCESDQLEWTHHPSEFPFSDSWNGLVHYNQQTAWKMDYRIRQAGEKGLFFRLTLLHWEDFDGENDRAPNWGWKRNPYNRSNGGPVAKIGRAHV